jgi:hypothetical protein
MSDAAATSAATPTVTTTSGANRAAERPGRQRAIPRGMEAAARHQLRAPAASAAALAISRGEMRGRVHRRRCTARIPPATRSRSSWIRSWRVRVVSSVGAAANALSAVDVVSSALTVSSCRWICRIEGGVCAASDSRSSSSGRTLARSRYALLAQWRLARGPDHPRNERAAQLRQRTISPAQQSEQTKDLHPAQ